MLIQLLSPGYMITAASAYFYDNALAGVAGVDIPMTDLLADVQYYNQAGPNTYAFLVAIKSGHVMSHPKLPKPESISEDPNSVNIFELEPGKEFRRLFDEVTETGEPRWVANYSQFDDFHPLPVNQ